MFIKINETRSLKSVFDVGKIECCFSRLRLLDYLERIGLKIIPSGSGMKSSMYYRIKPGYEDSGYREVYDILLTISNIEGYQYTIEVLPVENKENRK